MNSSKQILALITFLLLSTNSVWACVDYSCQPTWAIKHNGYDSCSNVPFLSPGNDTRVNLSLLMVDTNRAVLQVKTAEEEDAALGYGKVPFSVETFENSMFKPKTGPKDSDSENSAAGYGFGSRCMSNDSGKADFIQAVKQSKNLSPKEQRILIEARQQLTPNCTATPVSQKAAAMDNPSIQGTSPLFRQFMRYIAAVKAFYDGQYNEAESGFNDLSNCDHEWLRETSCYMLGRTKLNLAQQNAFDSYGFVDLNKVDQSSLQNAEAKFSIYLGKYPNGRYAASAKGLLRRVYWLSKQTEKLADEYASQLNHPESSQNNLSLHELILETDQKLFSSVEPVQIKDPLLLATLDLSLMRTTDTYGKKSVNFSDLQKQQPAFTGYMPLFEFLLAAHYFYVQNAAQQALKYLPDTIPHKMTYLDFSRLILRGLALEATKDYSGARKLWIVLLPLSKEPYQSETVQLALALNYEYSGMTEEVFKAGSPITEPKIRAILLRNTASAKLLRRVIQSKATTPQEQHIALYTLLYKDLLQGRYRDYIKDYRLLPKDAVQYKLTPYENPNEQSNLTIFTWSGKKSKDAYNCPSTLYIAERLAKDPRDPDGLLCLGDFVNTNHLESEYQLSEPSPYPLSAPSPGAAVLGSSPTQFPGKLFSRGEAYRTIITNPKVTQEQEAYALFRLIWCYATSGSNHCGGQSVEESVRKSWFNTLKSRHSNTVWSKGLKYYW